MQRCGSLTDTVRYPPVPLPVMDELVHAIDGERTVLFIWRERWLDQQTGHQHIDQRHVNLVRSDIGPDDEARALDVSCHAIDEPAWIASIILAMGFDLFSSRFAATPVEKVPADQWRFLRDAVNRRNAEVPA
jgi:hypothetical protein